MINLQRVVVGLSGCSYKFLFTALISFMGLTIRAEALVLDHTYSNPQVVKVTHTHLDLTIDFDEQVLRGKATIKATRRLGNQLKLDQVGLKIRKISGDAINWKILPFPVSVKKGLGEPLVIQIPENKSEVEVTIEYETSKDAPGIVWMQPEQTRSEYPFMFTMQESIGGRSVFPCQDTPSVRGTYSADLKIVSKKWKGLTALIAGDNNPHKATDTMEYKGLKSEQAPIPSYLFVLAAGRFFYHPVSDTVGYYADNERTLSDAITGLKDVPKYYSALEKLLGKNPWNHQDFLFLPAMFGYGGMENPQLIYINEALIEPTGSAAFVMAHELAHQWTGNIVTNRTWSDFWLNEGWTSYMEGRALEEVHGKEFSEGNSYERHLELAPANEERMNSPHHPVFSQSTQLYKYNATLFHPDDFFDVSVYGKGANLLTTLEKLVGREAFDEYARNYISHFTFKPVDSREFIDFTVMEMQKIKVLPEYRSSMTVKWRPFLEAWIYYPGITPTSLAGWIQDLGVPQCPNCDERLQDFKVKGSKTDFRDWNGFQIRYLLQSLKTLSKTDLEEATQWASQLYANPGFIEKIGPFTEIRGPWYELLAKTGLWEERADEIATFLSEVGRGRVIRPVYVGFLTSSAKTKEKGVAFVKEIFLRKKNSYFAPVSAAIQATMEEHGVLPKSE